jgi:hypothetical protein
LKVGLVELCGAQAKVIAAPRNAFGRKANRLLQQVNHLKKLNERGDDAVCAEAVLQIHDSAFDYSDWSPDPLPFLIGASISDSSASTKAGSLNNSSGGRACFRTQPRFSIAFWLASENRVRGGFSQIIQFGHRAFGCRAVASQKSISLCTQTLIMFGPPRWDFAV